MSQRADSRDVPGTAINSGDSNTHDDQHFICGGAVAGQSACPVRLRRRLQTVQATAPLAGRAAALMVPAAALPGPLRSQGGGGAGLGGCRAVVLAADGAVRQPRSLRGQIRGQEVCPAHELHQLHVFLHSMTRPCSKRLPDTGVTSEMPVGSHRSSAGHFISALLLVEEP